MPSRATLVQRAADPLARTVTALGLLRRAKALGVYEELASAVKRDLGLEPPKRRTPTKTEQEARHCHLCPRVVGSQCRATVVRAGPLEETIYGEPIWIGSAREDDPHADECGWEGPPQSVCPEHAHARNVYRDPCVHEVRTAATFLLATLAPGQSAFLRGLHSACPAPAAALALALSDVRLRLGWTFSAAMYGPIRVTRPKET